MTLDEALAPFRAVLAEPRPGGAGAVGWIGLDVPLEIFDAAGLTPVRIAADPAEDTRASDRFGEGGGQPEMRALVARLADGSLGHLSRVVIGSAPVTGVWLYNLLLALGADRPGWGRWEIELFDLLRNDRASALSYDLESVRDLAQDLGVDPEGPALAAAIAARNRLRALLRRVDALRFGEAPRLTGSGAQLVFAAVEATSVQAAAGLLEDLLAAAPALPVCAGLPAIYCGAGSFSRSLYTALEAEGLRIVADDQDFGTRAIGPDTEPAGEPLQAIAERYRNRFPAPAGWSARRRADWLAALVRARGARAVVFCVPSFDHPSGWDLPAEIAALDAAGVGCVVLASDAWRAPAATARSAAEALISGSSRRAVHV